MPSLEDDVRCCLWCGGKGRARDECFKRLPVAQRETDVKLVATTSDSGITNNCLAALEEHADRIDEALTKIQDVEADISTIKGHVEMLLNWKSDTSRRPSKNDEDMSRFAEGLKEHTKAQQNTKPSYYSKARRRFQVLPSHWINAGVSANQGPWTMSGT